MKRHIFIPTVYGLENRNLLSLANFGRQMVVDPADQTGHTAYGLVGMNVLVNIVLPEASLNGGTYDGLWEVKVTTSDGISFPKYSLDAGETGEVGQIERTAKWESKGNRVLGPKTYMDTTTLGKDEGDVTITIDVKATWTKPGIPGFTPPSTGTDSLSDVLVVHVEAPQVLDFHLGNIINPDADAPGMGFHLANEDGSDFVPPSEAETFMFSMSTGDPVFMSGVGIWSNIYNDTHYDINIGFIQELDSYTKRTFSSGKADMISTAGSYVLDCFENGTINMYNFEVFVPAGTTRLVPNPARTSPSGISLPNTVLHDSPAFGSSFGNIEDGYLQLLEMQMNFQTNVVMTKAFLPGASFTQTSWKGLGEGSVSGSTFNINPIALSTATWHMYGRATLSGNTDRESTVRGAWNVVVDIGPSSYSGGNSNSPWKAVGDNVVKFIGWHSNITKIRSDSLVSLNRPFYKKGGPMSVKPNKDWAAKYNIPVYVKPELPETTAKKTSKSEHFQRLCSEAGVEPTKRQAAKFNRRDGRWKGVS